MPVKIPKVRPLTPKQKAILHFVISYQNNFGYAPSLEEIAKEFQLRAVSTIHQHLDLICKKGYLQKDNFQKRGINTIETQLTIQIPLLGRIAAGNPIESLENPEPIDVPRYLINGQGDFYALEIRGNSMIDDHVWDGDIVLIKHQNTAETGDMIVAVIDGSVTLKRFGGIHNGMVKLIPKNPSLGPFYVSQENFEVRGKFAGLIRRSE